MTENAPWYKPEEHYKQPEREPDTFTIADWLLNTHQGLNRLSAATDLTRVRIEARYITDSLASLAAKLAARDPVLGQEILDAVKADPQHDYGEIDYRVELELGPSSDNAEGPPQAVDES